MASRRKSTTPCMVPARDNPDPDAAELAPLEEGPGGGEDLNMAEGGYECKYCSFQTSELNLFTRHVDTEHPNVVLNTSYVCVECHYHTKSYDTLQAHNARLHPGEDNFTRTMVKRNNETVFQQMVNDLTFDGSFIKMEAEEGERAVVEEEAEATDTVRTAIALSKTPIMRIRSRPAPKKFCTHKASANVVIKVESDEDEENKEPPTLSPAPTTPAATPQLLPLSAPVQVQAVPQNLLVNSSNMLQIKGSSGVLPPGTLAQVLSALQNQNSPTQTQLLIPISSIPTYNTAMDNNVLLASAYNRFPYPSLSEILGLSSQTKFSEEQIKVWFSAQRLKHGVSWTPEEVEEARRKKFNGTVQAVPQTITVIPANIATANGLQPIFQTCQIVGQPGLVLTQVAGNGATVPVASPLTLTVASVPGNQPKAAEPSASESKTELSASSAGTPLGVDTAVAGKPKKSKEQLAELKASYGRRQFATEAEISRLMQVTKLSKRAIKKWFSDTRYNQRNSKDHHSLLSEASGRAVSGRAAARVARSNSAGLNDGAAADGVATIIIDSSDETGEFSPTSGGVSGSLGSTLDRRIKFRHAFPDFTPQRFKEKTAEQLLLLESSFQKSDMPSDEELSRLRAETKLTRREVDAWFTERRKMPSASKNSDCEGDAGKSPSSPSERQTPSNAGRRAVKRTPEQLTILKRTFIRTQWPTPEEYDQMATESGLPRSYIVNWFGDTRYSWKNNSLKWYYLYQIGKVDEALNGGAKSHKKSRKRFRGWSRRTRRPYPCKRSPPGGALTIKVKPGKSFLKDYYVKHGFLSESDLDELVTKSSMSYQQVRDWFSETAKRAEDGRKLFSDEEDREDREDQAEDDGVEDMEEEEAADQQARSDREMEVKEQGDEEDDVKDELWDKVQEKESEGISQSQPEEQT